MRTSTLLVLLALTIVALSPVRVTPQPVGVEHVANVGDTTGGEAFLASLGNLIVLDDGRIVVSDRGNPPLRIFGGSGEFLRTLGRTGEGPGEYGGSSVLVEGREGDIEIFSVGRRVVYSSAFEHVDTDPIASPVTTLEMTRVGDHYVRARALRTPQSAGLPIHVFARDGEFVRSFGADPPIRDVRERLLFARRLAPSSDSTFWSADLLRFRLQHWTIDGELLAEITREPDWFPPQEDIGIDSRRGPQPWLNAISHDSDAGVVWTATLVPKEDWESAPTRAQVGAGIGQPVVDSQRERERVYRTIVEAIDPETGAVLGSGEIDAMVTGISNERYAYGEARTPDGQPVARIWRLTLRR